MRRTIRRAAAIAGAGLALTVAAPVTTAHAIARVECGDRTDVVRVTFETGDGCFTDAGTLHFDRGHWARSVSAGDNDITVGIYGLDGTMDVPRGEILHLYRTLQIRVITIH